MVKFCKKKPVCIIISCESLFLREISDVCSKCSIPLLKTELNSSFFYSSLVSYLNDNIGPFIGIHAVLVEVFDKGVLILGESKAGKSSLAFELVRRGHFFISDDLVKIRIDVKRNLIGFAPENIKSYMELKGVGIISIKEIFGKRAIKQESKIDFAIEFSENRGKERTTKEECLSILDVNIRKYSLLKSDKINLANLVEVLTLEGEIKKEIEIK